MKKCCAVCCTFDVLLAVGGLNWGLVGIGGFLGSDINLVNMLLGSVPVAENIVYALVGIAGFKALLSLCGVCCPCKGSCKTDGMCKCGGSGECKCSTKK